MTVNNCCLIGHFNDILIVQPGPMKYPLALILLILHCSSIAQFQKFSSDLFFNRYSTDDGLSQASVNAILKDSKGFMWFGTDDGLNRFDGHQFRVYKKKAGDSTTVTGNTVEALWEDSLSRIWVGTSEGLSIYDRHLEKFSSYPVPGVVFYPCFELREDSMNDRVWIAAGVHGLYYFDLQRNAVVPFAHAELKDLNVVKIETLDSKLYLGTLDKGLYCLDLRSNKVSMILLENERGGVNHAIRALLKDKDILWIGTEGDGLKKYNPKTQEIIGFRKRSGNLSDDKIWSLAIDGDRLWVGTDGGGLTLIDLKKNVSSVYRHSYYDIRSISSNTVRCISKDRIGDLWFGTFNGGISYLPAFNIKFHSFRNEPEDPASLPHNSVLSFCELSDGTLLVGTDGGGLAYLKDGKFYSYRFPRNVPTPTVILSILETQQGEIFLGTYQEGLYKILPNKLVKHYEHDPLKSSTITSNIIWDIAEDGDGNIWLSTEVGLNRLRPDEDEFTSYRNNEENESPGLFTSDFTQTLLVDSANTLWVGYFGNLTECYLPTGTTRSYFSGAGKGEIPNKQVLSLHLDRSNRNVLWFSSFGAGLARFHLIEKTFTILTEEQGLPGSQIFAIQTDEKGIVWCSSDKGLVRHDPRKRSFYTFEKSYGINTSPFKDNSGGSTGSGYIMFGGTNGFTAFWPSDVNFQKNSLDVVFTGFRLFNEEVRIDNKILERSITETNALRIPYDRSKFMNLEFAVPNFLSPGTVQYQYMLEGFEDSWHTVENKNISFTNLLPGKYTLRVKAGFPSALWGEERVLAITVVPAWWMTWYARIAFLLLVGAVGYAFYVYRTYSLNQRKAELEEIVAEQYQEIHQKNEELATRNHELSAHNEELLTSRETISLQNKMLFDAQKQLQEINVSLEKLVQQRTEKLNETISQLNKTIKELDAFLYSASHDLVSPLKSILGLVNLAKLENSKPQLRNYFNHIEISVSKLEAIIQTLMQHSFNTKAELRLEAIDLRKLVDETIGELKFIPEAEKIRFNLTLSNAQIVSDAHRLKIILSNLLGNAVKYHDSTKPENIVNLEFRKNGSGWILDITDNGIGIEKERLTRVFELFYRATESAKGSGLGLYIVKDTIDRLGGCIVVDSEIGKWTKFTLSFPLNNKAMLN
jgi:signal transduction histidine kinase/ligand-binding sensor domain-containing protein